MEETGLTSHQEGGVAVNERGLVESVEPLTFIPGVQPVLPFNSTVTCYGKRRSGKSVFMRWLLFEALREWVPFFFAFTYTKHNSFMEGFMPSHCIQESFDAEKLMEIMTRQKEAIKKFLSNPKNHPNPFNPRVCVLWDDYNGRDIKFNSMLDNYYYTGR